jgi:hypothetical protein
MITSTSNRLSIGGRVTAAARRLYDAEVQLHAAHQSHVDNWITAASDKLHDAIADHLAEVEAAHRGERPG